MAPTPSPRSSSDDPSELDRCIEAFEQALRRDERPRLSDFLPNGPERTAVLVELVHVELEFRLKAGEPVRVEEYLAAHPALAADQEAVVELLAMEFRFRLRRGDALSLEDYRRRFPDHAVALAERLDNLSTAGNPTPRDTPRASLPVGSPTIPGYELLGELGRGGMGVVYKARQLSLNRIVALKMLAGSSQEEHLARFRREAEAVARLQHPNIVQIYEIGEHQGQPYFSMEYVAGGTLQEAIAGRPQPARAAAELVETLARAIHSAHEHGVIHRDLKPANVLLSFSRDALAEREPSRSASASRLNAAVSKITDFGLARLQGAAGQRTESGAVLGTPGYMAPEQVLGRQQDIQPATDVYALGAILYHALTGQPPFRGQLLEVLDQTRSHDVPPPGRFLREAGLAPPDRDLEIICLKCLNKEPGQRYLTAQALADDLRRFLKGEPIRARPPSWGERTVRWVRRNPTWAALVFLASLVAVGLPIGLSIHLVRVEAALDRARHAEEATAQERYASDVRLADQLLRSGDPFTPTKLLQRYTTDQGVDRRGFEWHYLNRFRQTSSPEWRAHTVSPDSLAFTSDGQGRLQSLITGSTGHQVVRSWGLPGRELLWEADSAYGVAPPALSPNGRLLARVPSSPSGTGHVILHDPRTKDEVGRVAAPAGIGLAFSPNSTWLAVRSMDQVTVWDVRDAARPALIHRAPDVPSPTPRCIAFAGDGRTLAVGVAGYVFLWETATWQPRPHLLLPGGAWGVTLAASPVGPLVAIGISGHQFLLCDSQTSRVVEAIDSGGSEVLSLAFSQDGRRVAAGTREGRLFLWDVITRQLIRWFRWQPQALTGLAFTPDGRQLAVGTSAGFVQVVGLGDPPQVAEAVRPRFIAAGPVAFSPDGRTLAVAVRPTGFRLLDAQNLDTRLSVTHGLAPVTHLAMLAARGQPGAARVVTAEADHSTAVVWDAASGEVLHRLGTTGGPIRALAASPDGARLAIATADDRVRLWDAASGTVTRQVQVAGVQAIAFAPTGQALATGSTDSMLRLWDLGQASDRPQAERKCHASVIALAFLSDRLLVSSQQESAVAFWDVRADGQLVENPKVLHRPEAGFLSLHSTPDGGLIGRQGQKLHSWSVADGSKRWSLGSTGTTEDWQKLAQFACSPDGRRAALTAADGSLRTWELGDSKIRGCVTRPADQPLGPVQSLAFTSDGLTLLTGGAPSGKEFRFHYLNLLRDWFGKDEAKSDRKALQNTHDSVRSWDVQTRQELPGPAGHETLAPPSLVALSPDGALTAAGGSDGVVWLWARSDRRLLTRLVISDTANIQLSARDGVARFLPDTPGTPEATRSLAFSPSSRLLLSLSTSGVLTIWETTGWTGRWSLARARAKLEWATFGPDDGIICAGGGRVERRDPSDGHLLAILGTCDGGKVECGTLTADGRLLAVATEDRRIHLWDLRTGGHRNLVGHADRVTGLAFHPDGRTLASSSWDRTVRLWNVAVAQEVAMLTSHHGKVLSVAFSPDGQTLASGGEGPNHAGEVLFWRAVP